MITTLNIICSEKELTVREIEINITETYKTSELITVSS